MFKKEIIHNGVSLRVGDTVKYINGSRFKEGWQTGETFVVSKIEVLRWGTFIHKNDKENAQLENIVRVDAEPAQTTQK